jgi:hypothetical protein
MASEIVRVRVMGAPEAVDLVVANLQAAALPWLDVRDVSAPYANRGRGGGVRRYLAVLVPVSAQPGERER